MSDDDYIFEFRKPDSNDWVENLHTKYLMTTHIRDLKPGVLVLSTNGDYRKVPKDPLLRAIVLAQVEASHVA